MIFSVNNKFPFRFHASHHARESSMMHENASVVTIISIRVDFPSKVFDRAR